MSPLPIIIIIFCYFLLLIGISYITSGKSDNDAFFLGNKQSPWYIVAFGMIGASLSGVTFISVPGWVGVSQFSYMQMVLGYMVGYFVIATILMPMYYRLNLTSIYTYLEQRFGFWSYKTGAFYFLLSRIIGASFRLYLVAIVLQLTVFDKMDIQIPFVVTVIITILLIWLYTNRGGIKTIIWTDSFQTLFMLIAVGITIWLIGKQMNLKGWQMIEVIRESKYSQIFFFDNWNDPRHFVKQFISGAFIAIAMTGLDQDMMQKNLSCKNIGDAQKNMLWFSIVLVFVNLLFLALGALLYLYTDAHGITLPEKSDYLFPMIAIDGYIGIAVAVFFILGLVAAAYSSADSALTALTTSFCIDFLDINKRPENKRIAIRKRVHILISVLLVIVILIFKAINDESVISELFKAAGYTYGPLLGLYSFGLFNKQAVKDKWVPWVCILSPLLTYVLNSNSKLWFNGFEMGFMLLVVNGLLTYIGLWLIMDRRSESN